MIKCYAAVMQSWMSLFCNTWCPVLLHSKSKNRRFAPHGTCLVRHSNNWFHEDWSQCSISGQYTSTVLSSLILLVFVCCLQPSSPGPSYFILFSLSAFLEWIFSQTNYLCPVSGHGCPFLMECSYETRLFGGSYFRFRSLRYSRHTSHMQVEFLLP